MRGPPTPCATNLHLTELGPLEWVVVAAAAVAAVWVIWKAVRLTMHPGETEPDHWKRMILDEPGGAAPSEEPEPRP